jgi:hypothetical protein
VGDRVTTAYHPEEAEIVRTVTRVEPYIKSQTGVVASADGGDPCVGCGRPLGRVIGLVDSSWFRKEVEPEWVAADRFELGDAWVPHIRMEGAHIHVISWSNLGRQCSEPRCEINKPKKEVGYDDGPEWEPDARSLR